MLIRSPGIRNGEAAIIVTSVLLLVSSTSSLTQTPRRRTAEDDDSDYRGPIYKRGVPQTFQNLQEMQLMDGLGWWFNYGMEPQAEALLYGAVNDIEYVPAVWGDWVARGKTTDEEAYEYLTDRIPFNSKAVMLFNEPNHRLQSNVTPERAAELWEIVEKVADARDLRIGSPSANPCNVAASAYDCMYASPFRWWDDFFSNCTRKYGSRGCRVDFMTSHYYSCSTRDLAAYLRGMARYKKPVWLAEFACPDPVGNTSMVRTFMQGALTMLDRSNVVERYAWFAPHTEDYEWLGTAPSLLEPGVQPPALTPLGTLYLTGAQDSDVQVSTWMPIHDEGGPDDWEDKCRACWEGENRSQQVCWECGFAWGSDGNPSPR